MIIIRISGGIGNQLFQYSLGRALSLQNGGSDALAGQIKLDVSFYGLGIEPGRSFKLPHFTIPRVHDMLATPKDFRMIGVPDPARQDIVTKIRRMALRSLESHKPLPERKMILEPRFGFCPEVLDLKGDHYLSGVWQSEKYFADYAEKIRKDFELAAPFSEAAGKIAHTIASAGEYSVSIHVRRGDQINDPKLLAKHGDLNIDYYRRAVEYIYGKISANKNASADPTRVFVFSDDIEWCKDNIRFDGGNSSKPLVTYVSDADIPDYEELTLMSLCKHDIIAKSSFSWWGAWLNKNPRKIVIAPKQRFGTETGKPDDLIPDSWTKL